MNVKIWGYQFWTVLAGWAHLQSEAPPPEAESLFAFGRLIVQYFAVFIRFSGDNVIYEPFFADDEFAEGGGKISPGGPGPCPLPRWRRRCLYSAVRS